MSTTDHIYWTFSSAAQVLAAVVAFLLAGYALVHLMMEAVAAADETLRVINDELKRQFHRQLSVLTVLTVAAIVVDLGVVYINGQGCVHWVLQLTAAILTVASLVCAVVFVTRVVDPGKHQRTARKLAGSTTSVPPGAAGASAADFFFEFIEIERRIRKLWETRTDRRRVSRRPGEPTFSEMAEALHLAEVLPDDLRQRLEGLSRTRNLVFHGHIEVIEPGVLEEARRVRAELNRLQESA